MHKVAGPLLPSNAKTANPPVTPMHNLIPLTTLMYQAATPIYEATTPVPSLLPHMKAALAESCINIFSIHPLR